MGLRMSEYMNFKGLSALDALSKGFYGWFASQTWLSDRQLNPSESV